MDILILAGGRCDPEMRQETGAEWRAMLPWDGTTMLAHTHRELQSLGRLIVVGPEGIEPKRDVEAGKSFVESLRNGLQSVQTESFLLVTADIPFVTAKGIQAYLDSCPPEVGVCYPLIPVDSCSREFPGLKRTGWKLKEGVFTGGNICRIRTEDMVKLLPKLEQAYAVRKNVLKLGSIVGFRTLVLLVLSKLVPGGVAKKKLELAVSKSLGVRAEGIIVDLPEIGSDIDSHDQYRIAVEIQKSRQGKL